MKLPAFAALSLLTLALGGCNGGGGDGRLLLTSVDIRNGDGETTAVTLLDHDSAGSLTRLRHYTAPGADNIWRTADDVLDSYSVCQVDSGDLLLQDPLAELGGQLWAHSRFSTRNCALEEHASAIRSQPFLSPGVDNIWFTPDDVRSDLIELQRTLQGSERAVSVSLLPPDCEVSCEPTDSVIYAPYPGFPTSSSMAIRYHTNARGLLATLTLGDSSVHYEYDNRNNLNRKTLRGAQFQLASGNITTDLYSPLILHSITESYQALGDGSRLARLRMLADAEPLESMAQSPTGQILLAIVGWTGPVREIDGERYWEITIGTPIRLVGKNGRVEELTELSGPGLDGEWGNGDDTIVRRQRYFYARH